MHDENNLRFNDSAQDDSMDSEYGEQIDSGTRLAGQELEMMDLAQRNTGPSRTRKGREVNQIEHLEDEKRRIEDNIRAQRR